MAWSKESRQSRGYDAEWDKVRAWVVERDKGLCQCCLAGGRVTIGKEVDHKVPKAEAARLGWSRKQIDDMSNLELKCHECHAKKTAAENGRVYRPRIEFGEDGWPKE